MTNTLAYSAPNERNLFSTKQSRFWTAEFLRLVPASGEGGIEWSQLLDTTIGKGGIAWIPGGTGNVVTSVT